MRTLETYKFHIMKFIEYINIDIVDVTTNTIRYYLAHVGTTCSNTYVDHIRRILNSFFTFCENEEYIQKNPCKRIDKIKINKEMEKPYSDTEVELIRNACITPREKALVNVLFSTGIRREELSKIKVQDIDFLERSIVIHGKGGKTRTVYFSARCELSIKRYLESKKQHSEYLFSSEKGKPTQLSRDSVARIVKIIGNRAGVSNVHLHRFRRWFGTDMANKNVPLQDIAEMMGHSKLETTKDYYIYANHERIKTNHKNNAA